MNVLKKECVKKTRKGVFLLTNSKSAKTNRFLPIHPLLTDTQTIINFIIYNFIVISIMPNLLILVEYIYFKLGAVAEPSVFMSAMSTTRSDL